MNVNLDIGPGPISDWLSAYPTNYELVNRTIGFLFILLTVLVSGSNLQNYS